LHKIFLISRALNSYCLNKPVPLLALALLAEPLKIYLSGAAV
jgi:hypothetical protein